MSRQRSPYIRSPADSTISVAPAAVPELLSEVEALGRLRRSGSVSSIPVTSPKRLTQSEDQADTVFYLAYGSNLCYETFQGRRGIKPLSAVNVSAPTLRLTLNLPGIPYLEPCFANVDFRKLPGQPHLPGDPKSSTALPLDSEEYAKGRWDGGLMGVVYEVTREDYRQIVRTEGGGSGYKEIVVPCIPLKPNATIPEKPPFPELPKPILARTLYGPYISYDGTPEDPRKDRWWYRWFLRPQRPDPDYAQASARYLKLITDGAQEHDLPEVYQQYLNSLQPYTRTSWMQTIGSMLCALVFAVPFLILTGLGKLVADKDGHYPKPFVMVLNLLFNVLWKTYDCVFNPIFGEGERTEEERQGRTFRRVPCGQADRAEKASLLTNRD